MIVLHSHRHSDILEFIRFLIFFFGFFRIVRNGGFFLLIVALGHFLSILWYLGCPLRQLAFGIVLDQTKHELFLRRVVLLQMVLDLAIVRV